MIATPADCDERQKLRIKPGMHISHIDHLVLTVADSERTCDFYTRVLGFQRQDEPGKPTALLFGTCKLNIHAADHTFEPKADRPTPGSGDFCLITSTPVEETLTELQRLGVPVEEGPVRREGASGTMTSIYLRDPDNNLVELGHLNETEG